MMSIALSFYKIYISMPEFLILLGVPTFKSSQYLYKEYVLFYIYLLYRYKHDGKI